ncbi:MAG: hypothetical protein H0U67_13070 [Gemmatimonadetes bacterium]|nr:hypothetical protein [Gemmatimonadota bacterium]
MPRTQAVGNPIIHKLGTTHDRLTGRAGLVLFSRYLRGVGILPELGSSSSASTPW